MIFAAAVQAADGYSYAIIRPQDPFGVGQSRDTSDGS
jgi:hypothetical protein